MAKFPDDEFDLVVNHAAAHHIAYIDRVFRELCRRLGEVAWFLSWDYVGPHRNQYEWDAWDAAATFNRSLPARIRQEMDYPHLPTMLADDPTEAIHSELILPTMRRYFHLDALVPLGGAIAYPLLTHNRNVFEASPDDLECARVIRTILAADDEYTAGDVTKTLFAYAVARPNKDALEDERQLATWTAEENEREAQAQANGGEYYPQTTLQELMLSREDHRVTALHATARADDLAVKLDDLTRAYGQLQARNSELQAQCGYVTDAYDDVQARYDRIMSMPPYQQIRWFARSGLGQTLRRDERVAKLKNKLSSS
ncbi:MAG: hypothetical protein HYX32_08090 [Actinobacteria bacterium]|nr:hypothetical protein [Actinomycetota bacterium]